MANEIKTTWVAGPKTVKAVYGKHLCTCAGRVEFRREGKKIKAKCLVCGKDCTK